MITCLIGYDELSREVKVLSGSELCGNFIKYLGRYSEPEVEARKSSIRKFFSTYWVVSNDVPYVVIQVSEVIGDSLGEVISALAYLEPDEVLNGELGFREAEGVRGLGKCIRCRSLAKDLSDVLTALLAHGRVVNLKVIKEFLRSLSSNYPLIRVSKECRELFIDSIYLIASIASLSNELRNDWISDLLRGVTTYLVSEVVPKLPTYGEDLTYLVKLIVKSLIRSSDPKYLITSLIKASKDSKLLTYEVIKVLSREFSGLIKNDLIRYRELIKEVPTLGLNDLRRYTSCDSIRDYTEVLSKELSTELSSVIKALGGVLRTYCIRLSRSVRPTLVIGGCLRRIEGIELLNGSAGIYAVMPSSGIGLGTPELIIRYSRRSDLSRLRDLMWYLLNDGVSTKLNKVSKACLIDGFGHSLILIKEVLKKDSLTFLKVERTGATRVGTSAVPYTIVSVGREFSGLRIRGVRVKPVSLSASTPKPYALVAIPIKVGMKDYVLIKLVVRSNLETYLPYCR